MNWPLFEKEAREHWRLLAALSAALLAIVVLMAIANARRGEAISAFESLRIGVLTFTPPAAIALAQGLFAGEIRGRTILFLETLPVARLRVALVKLAFGAIALLAPLALLTGWVVLIAARREPVDARFAGLVLARTLSFALSTLMFCVFASVLGRYRIPLLVAIGLALAVVSSRSGYTFDTFGPIALMGPTFAVEREAVPVGAFATTLELAVGSGALALAILLVREGSVAMLLGEKMSHRERVFMAGLLVFGTYALAEIDGRSKVPYRLQEAGVVERRGDRVTVQILPAPGDRASLELAEEIARGLSVAAEYLGIDRLPPVFVIHRGDLDPGRMEPGKLAEREGVLVRSNLGSSLDRRALLAYLIGAVLDARSHGRTAREDRMWVRDGFAQWFASRAVAAPARGEHGEERRAEQGGDEQQQLRALYAARAGWSLADRGRWHQVREGVGVELAAALGWSGVQVLAEAVPEDRLGAFLRAALGAEFPDDFRSTLRERSTRIDHLLAREAGLPAPALVERWQGFVARSAAERAAVLAAIPRFAGRLEIEALSTRSRGVRFVVEVPALGARTASVAAGVPASVASVVYRELGPVDDPIPFAELSRFDVSLGDPRRPLAPGSSPARLPGSFSVGARYYFAFAFQVPELGCEVLASAERRTIE